MNHEWRKRLAENRRAEQAKRQAALAADPRVQALKERLHAAYGQAKERRKQIAEAREQRQRDRDAVLRDSVPTARSHPSRTAPSER
jgi:hypothetical protein